MSDKEKIVACACGAGVIVRPGKAATCPLCSSKCGDEPEISGPDEKPEGRKRGGANAGT